MLVPTKTEYAFEATKKTIDILKGAAGLVGVPLVKEVLNVGLALITACEASKHRNFQSSFWQLTTMLSLRQ